MRLGINSMIALYNNIHTRKVVEKLNLADNAITDYGMHSVKNMRGRLRSLHTDFTLPAEGAEHQGNTLAVNKKRHFVTVSG